MNPKITKILKNGKIRIIHKANDRSVLKLERDLMIITKKLQDYYGIKSPKIEIELIYSRKELDRKCGRRTPKWLVALAENNNIYIASPSVVEKISHHKKTESGKILTHELCHVYNDKISQNSLMWINEGMALFISGQKKSGDIAKKELTFFYDNYMHKNIDLKTFSSRNGYRISYWAIGMIAEKYGKAKMLDLLKINRNNKNCRMEMKRIFGKLCEYLPGKDVNK